MASTKNALFETGTITVPSGSEETTALERSTGASSSGSSKQNINLMGALGDKEGNTTKPHDNKESSPLPGCFAMPRAKLSRTVLLRTIFVLSLATAAALCAGTSFTVISRLETDVGKQTYESVATSALQGAQAITHRKIAGGHVMASIMSFAFPDAHQWPFVALYGYTEINEELGEMSQSNEHGLVPLVDPTVVNVSAYQDFLDAMYRSNGFEDHVGYSDFGFGIWKKEVGVEETQYEDGRLPDTEPNDYGGTSNHTVLAPLIEVGHKQSKNLLINLRFEPFRRAAIDSMLDCASYRDGELQGRAGIGKDNDSAVRPCLVVSDMLELLHRAGPAGLMYTPVYPVHNPTTLVGITSTVIIWQDVLENIVPDYVNGLVCVISTHTQSYTFEIQHGVPVLLGDGDLHDDSYDHLAHSVILDDIETDASASAIYTLTVYPTATMMSAFQTSSPWIVALGFVLTIAFCTGIFCIYDCLMRYEVSYRQHIMEVKRQYMRFISHEIRTPLNTVCMGLELIEEELRTKRPAESVASDGGRTRSLSDTSSSTKQKDALLHDVCLDIQENAHTAVEVLNDILNYDKIETNTLTLELSNVAIWQLLQRTVQQFQVQALNGRIKLELIQAPATPEDDDVPHSLRSAAKDLEAGVHSATCGSQTTADLTAMSVVGDEVRLGQLLRNTISNALKFTPANGTITVKATHFKEGLSSCKFESKAAGGEASNLSQDHPRAGSIHILVKDTGVGMSPDQLARLFNDGVQFDANKLQHGGGSGLGLVIAKGIVEQHGGSITVASEGIGHGTAFSIELPLFHIRDTPIDVEQKPVTQEASTKPAPLNRRVLVVDDVMSNRKMLVRLLERSGHTCDTATNGEGALRAIEDDMAAMVKDGSHAPFDTILMDYEMPIMNGPDATEHIRALGYQGTIFGVTGNVLQEDTSYFLSKGADEILSKPISIGRLQESWAKLE